MNHLIARGPRLDRKTLHIKVSFYEWMAILWLNWLTCSTRSIWPLWTMNVGWWKRRGSLAPSILRVKGRLRDLIQGFIHGIITQALTRWSLVLPSMMVLVFIREGLTWGSSWSPPVIAVLFIIRGYVEAGRRPPSLCMAQSLFWVVYLLLHGSMVVLSLGYATAHLRGAFVHLGDMHTPL